MSRACLIAVVGASLLAGCGGDGGGGPLSKEEYERQFKQVLAKAAKEPRLTTPQGASLREQADVVDKGLDRLRTTAADLGRLEPPKEVAGAHRDLTTGTRQLADDGEKVVTAMRAGDRRRLEMLLPERGGSAFASPSTARKILGARREFKRKGYDLGAPTQLP